MVTHSGAGRYALASMVRNWYTSYFERNFAANSAVVIRCFAEVDIYIAFDKLKLYSPACYQSDHYRLRKDIIMMLL